jgi:ketosteroid isomerase-like protein
MESANIELVRSLYPPGGLDWAVITTSRAAEAEYRDRVDDLLHPDFEVAWVDPGPGASSGTAVGAEAYLKALREAIEGFDRFRIVPERFVDLGDRVAVLGRLEARVRADGAELTETGGAILTILEGRVRLLQEFPTRKGLLEAAGISAEEAEARGVDAQSAPV